MNLSPCTLHLDFRRDGNGIFPILDINNRSLPNVTEQFSAQILFLGLRPVITPSEVETMATPETAEHPRDFGWPRHRRRQAGRTDRGASPSITAVFPDTSIAAYLLARLVFCCTSRRYNLPASGFGDALFQPGMRNFDRGSNARLALRMRVSMSAMGSVIGITSLLWSLQGSGRTRRPHETRAANNRICAGKPCRRPLIGAAVHQPDRAGIARQLGQPGVIVLGFQLGTERGILLHRRALALVALDP